MTSTLTKFMFVHSAAIGALLALAPIQVIAQDGAEPLPNVEIGSEEFNQLSAGLRIQIVREPVIVALNNLRDRAPQIFAEGEYTYTGEEDELEAMIGLMRELSSDLSIGGPLYQQISAGIADANALEARVREFPDFTEEERTALLADVAAQLGQWQDLRTDFDLLRNQMEDFTNTRAPALQEAYEIRSQITDNATALAQLTELRDAAQDFFEFARTETGTTGSGTD